MLTKRPDYNEVFNYGEIVSWEFKRKIYKNYDKYLYRFTVNFSSGKSKNYQRGGFYTLRDAEKSRELIIHSLYTKTFVPFSVPIKDFYDYWLYYYMIDEQNIAYNTFQSYKNIIYNYLIPYFGRKCMNTLTEKEVSEFLLTITSKSILTMCKCVLYSSFRYAEKYHYIANDFSKVAVKRATSIQKREMLKQQKDNPSTIDVSNNIRGKVKKQYVVLTVPQVAYLIKKTKELHPEIAIALMFTVTCGTRISESFAVKFKDVDYNSKTISIKRQIGVNLKNGLDTIETKTDSGIRIIPIADFVLDEITLAKQRYKSAKKNNPHFHDNDFISFKPSGACFRGFDVYPMLHEIIEACQDADGFPSYFTWHDLRHTYASLLKQNKVSLKAISVYMGHSSDKITEDVYVHEKNRVVWNSLPYLDDVIKDVTSQREKEICSLALLQDTINRILS